VWKQSANKNYVEADAFVRPAERSSANRSVRDMESWEYDSAFRNQSPSAMSGGVDSSAVAAMLRAEGRNVIGLTMQLWNQPPSGWTRGHARNPSRAAAVRSTMSTIARRVAETLGIPLLRGQPRGAFLKRDVVRPFRRGVSCRPHAHSLQSLQQSLEV